MVYYRSPASIYNNYRRILFSKVHKDGFHNASEYLESVVKKNLIRPAYLGLKEELYFYKGYGEDYKLTVSADVGDHSDFSGSFQGRTSRFDVTTNIEYKKLSDYEPFQGKGVDYLIVLMDKNTNELQDIFNINFPFCKECRNRLFEVLFVTPHQKTSDSTIQYGMSDVSVIQVCPNDPIIHSKTIISESYGGISDFSTFIEELPREDEFNELGYRSYKKYKKMIEEEPKRYGLENVKYFRKVFDRNIVAMGSPEHVMLDRHTDFWRTHLYWVNPIVSGHIDSILEDNLEEVYQ